MKNYMMNSKKMVFCLGLLVAGFSTSLVWADGQSSSDKPCEVGSTNKEAPPRASEPVPATGGAAAAASATGAAPVVTPAPAPVPAANP